MAKHRKYDLLYQLVDAINEGGWNVMYLSDISQHPFSLRIYNSETSHTLRVYIWNLTHGDGSARPKDEYRIQITGVNQFSQAIGEKTLILGWWQEVGVFAGFDFYRHNNKLGASPSIQIREENLRKALINGFSACDRSNGEIAIAFRPDFFATYVENLESLHGLGDSPQTVEIFEEVAEGKLEVNATVLEAVSQPRQVTLQTVNKKLRASSFTRRVLNAYSQRCAISGMQLKLVDAAHIVPVNEANSTDETCNGIALSPLYHRAYDKGLVTFNENYQVIVNENALKSFKMKGLDGGIEHFQQMLRPVIIVPPSIQDRPNLAYLVKANKLRGWG